MMKGDIVRSVVPKNRWFMEFDKQALLPTEISLEEARRLLSKLKYKFPIHRMNSQKIGSVCKAAVALFHPETRVLRFHQLSV